MALDLDFDLSALDDENATSAPDGTVATAPLDAFEEDPDNIRFEDEDPDEFAAFVADIEARGILQPVVVRKMDSGALRIRFGHRRYRAAAKLGLNAVPFVLSEDEDAYSQYAENTRRKNTTPLEDAIFVKRRLAAGEKKKDIAKAMQIDASAITHLMALVEEPVPEFLLELYHGQRCRTPKYLHSLRKLHSEDAERVERRCAEAEEITQAFIKALRQELDPRGAVAPPAGDDRTVQDALDDPATAGGGFGDSEGAGGGGAGASDEGPGATQVPGYTPEDPPAGPKPTDPSKIKKPLLLGKYNGDDVRLLLDRRPSSPGLVVIRYEEGIKAEEEVDLGAVTLTLLADLKHSE